MGVWPQRRVRAFAPWGKMLPLLVLAVLSCAAGESPAHSPGDLADASLEDLMNMEVSSPARKEQKLSQTASAVYVITQEDIRRSGLTSIPELLRMVPGLAVARISANSWSVTSRGFAGRFADKMLVLIDGRSIFNHLNSGVYWEQNMVPLDDIERIEVIRGPGAVLWGTNAVNGVINIITKPARETQGLTITSGSGNEEPGFGSLRYGGAAGGKVFYRASLDYFQDGPFTTSGGQPAHDHWDSAQGGGRLDWQASERDTLRVEADLYHGGAQQTIYPDYPAIGLGSAVPDAIRLSGGYASARWQHQFSERSDVAMQLSFTGEGRTEGFGELDTRTTELDFQHHIALSPRHDWIWGLNLQNDDDATKPGRALPAPSATVQFVPASTSQTLASLFAQDQIALVPARLILTLGAQLEHTGYSGSNLQANGRLLWSATPRQGFWTAVSRAARAPALVDRSAMIEFQPTLNPAVVGILRGNPNFQPETEHSYEAGYRNQPARWVTFDLAAFFSRYRDLRTIDAGVPYLAAGPPPVLIEPMEFGNGAVGHTYGAEVSTNWDLARRWRVTGNYSFFHCGLDAAHLAADSTPLDAVGSSPAHQVQLRSQWDLGRRVELDAGFYYVSALTGLAIPGYLRSDARLGWRLTRTAEISLAGQNLLNGRHREFAGLDYVQGTWPGRAAEVKVTWAF
ncbi:MAG TPA: TonB-dependent receptor [Bryobacteraceae bacterium]|nr:TonB-dependent receptor [Bryobacteraceae bacterium]